MIEAGSIPVWGTDYFHQSVFFISMTCPAKRRYRGYNAADKSGWRLPNGSMLTFETVG